MLPEVSQLLRCPCISLLHTVILLSHFPNPAEAVRSLKEVIVLLVLQLLQVNVHLCEVRQPCDLGVGGIHNVDKDIIDLQLEIRLAFGGQFPGSNLYGCLLQSDRSIGEEFRAEV